DERALKLERPFHGNFHDRLEDLRLRRGVYRPEGATRGCLKGVVRGVDGMRGSIINDHAEAGDRKADQASLRYHRPEALLDRTYEFLRNRTTEGVVDKLKVAFFHRLDVSGNTTVLSGAAGLLLVCVIELRLAGDRFAVSNLGSSGFDLGAIFTLHSFDVD